MTVSRNPQEREVLRIALDKKAASDFETMINRIKAENPHVRVHPSAFVSFLLSDFFVNYFEKDLNVLVAEFFDSKSYYEDQMREAKCHGDFEKVMSAALATIKKVKAKTRRNSSRRSSKKTKSTPIVSPE